MPSPRRTRSMTRASSTSLSSTSSKGTAPPAKKKQPTVVEKQHAVAGGDLNRTMNAAFGEPAMVRKERADEAPVTSGVSSVRGSEFRKPQAQKDTTTPSLGINLANIQAIADSFKSPPSSLIGGSKGLSLSRPQGARGGISTAASTSKEASKVLPSARVKAGRQGLASGEPGSFSNSKDGRQNVAALGPSTSRKPEAGKQNRSDGNRQDKTYLKGQIKNIVPASDSDDY